MFHQCYCNRFLLVFLFFQLLFSIHSLHCCTDILFSFATNLQKFFISLPIILTFFSLFHFPPSFCSLTTFPLSTLFLLSNCLHFLLSFSLLPIFSHPPTFHSPSFTLILFISSLCLLEGIGFCLHVCPFVISRPQLPTPHPSTLSGRGEDTLLTNATADFLRLRHVAYSCPPPSGVGSLPLPWTHVMRLRGGHRGVLLRSPFRRR